MADLRVLSVFGTRPEAIKMAPVAAALDAASGIAHETCVTGQHREMLDPVLAFFRLAPSHRLDVMREDASLADITAAVLTGVHRVIGAAAPDLVLVQGDANTTLSAALAAFYRQVPVGHVEAGLRSFDLAAPWPEEGNRKLVSALAALHFAPTETNGENLIAESVAPGRIHVTGNPGIDALQETLARLEADESLRSDAERACGFLDAKKRLILVTGHRRESFGDGFRRICAALRNIAERGDCEIVYPVHLNPNVKQPVFEHLAGIPNIHLREPLDYPAFVHLMGRAHAILTDSGGIQEEAPSLGKPVLVMRETTERPEAVEAGCARLVGTDPAQIVHAVVDLLEDPETYRRMSQAANPFGDGKAAENIVAAIRRWAAVTGL